MIKILLKILIIILSISTFFNSCDGSLDFSNSSDITENDITGLIDNDTITSSSALNLLSSPAYAKQNGKPVVSIYGLGYVSHPSDVNQALDLINWLKDNGCYVIGQWRMAPGQTIWS